MRSNTWRNATCRCAGSRPSDGRLQLYMNTYMFGPVRRISSSSSAARAASQPGSMQCRMYGSRPAVAVADAWAFASLRALAKGQGFRRAALGFKTTAYRGGTATASTPTPAGTPGTPDLPVADVDLLGAEVPPQPRAGSTDWWSSRRRQHGAAEGRRDPPLGQPQAAPLPQHLYVPVTGGCAPWTPCLKWRWRRSVP
eukprot:COSAG01_NODE_2301_length_7953_cov_4.000127_9_plen_197_part_00